MGIYPNQRTRAQETKILFKRRNNIEMKKVICLIRKSGHGTSILNDSIISFKNTLPLLLSQVRPRMNQENNILRKCMCLNIILTLRVHYCGNVFMEYK